MGGGLSHVLGDCYACDVYCVVVTAKLVGLKLVKLQSLLAFMGFL